MERNIGNEVDQLHQNFCHTTHQQCNHHCEKRNKSNSLFVGSILGNIFLQEVFFKRHGDGNAEMCFMVWVHVEKRYWSYTIGSEIKLLSAFASIILICFPEVVRIPA